MTRSWAWGGIATAVLAVAAFAGCSSQSRLRIYIDAIEDAENPGKTFMEADVTGSKSNPCTIVQETADVKVRLMGVSELGIGPDLGAALTRYVVEYFYFNPATGGYQAAPQLTTVKDNIRIKLIKGATVTVEVPVATYRVKYWSRMANPLYATSTPNCFGVTSPGQDVEQLVVKVTVTAEDDTGKTMTADGSFQLYLYDFGDPCPTGALTNFDLYFCGR